MTDENTSRPDPFGLRFDRTTVLACLAVTVAVELVCLLLRFGFNLESTTATASTIGRLTFGLRIHHGYIGALMIPIGVVLANSQSQPLRKKIGWLVFVIGVGLFASDMIHHFLVLWPITGSPQFDLVYPSQ